MSPRLGSLSPSLPSLQHQRQILQQLHKTTLNYTTQCSQRCGVTCPLDALSASLHSREKYNKHCNVCQVTLPRVCVDPLPHWYISFYFQIFTTLMHHCAQSLKSKNKTLKPYISKHIPVQVLLTLFSVLHRMECRELPKLPTNCAETPSSQLHIPLLLQKFQPWKMQQFS